MQRSCFFFYTLIIILYLVPFVPVSVKVISGIVFIMICSSKMSLKGDMINAALCGILGFIILFLNRDIGYKKAIINAFLVAASYYIFAFYFGNFAQTIENKNRELENEIEKRKKAEEELKKEMILFKGLMDTIPSPIFFKDVDLKYIAYNRAFKDAVGVKSDEAIGKTVYHIAEPQLASRYEKMDLEVLRAQGTQTYEDIVKFPDGSSRSIIFNKAVFTDGNEVPSGIVGVMTDITDEKEACKLKESIFESKQMMEKLLEHDKMKTEFFSNISHELRTPLNVILGTVQLMDLYTRDEEYSNNQLKVVRSIGTMRQNCYRLLKLVNNLIDISKIDAKAFELRLKNCNIISVVEEITLSVSDYIENKGIKLVFDTDVEEQVMACDDEKIERILLNLLSNAIKFTPKGGVIFVNLHKKDNGICIKVQDTGIGIPEDKQKKIFERFYQVEEMLTRKSEGSGIGLSLVKALVEMHGGTITLISQVGVGTKFIINLPFKTIEDNEIHHTTTTKQDHIERISVEFSDIYSVR
ncbi:sensor histidine kinase [Cellulosilyticum sp. I15G10I2]|uniref:sensor histidine kinase n=1 Tax=Cellulosilyticum sp. I15G10I2 TaxID=1892843 RepID=UPI00085C19BB|nr:HAMP domain-containing sensor histidine kinase [Cellulosilyticum sp. I15G10I2]